MIQAFSLIFNFFNIASPCGDMRIFENSIRIFSRQKIRINSFMHIKLYIKNKEKRATEKVVF